MSETGPGDGVAARGHLNPGSTATQFDRFVIDLPEVVRHIWTVRYSIPTGVLRQRVLGYPAINVVFEPDVAALYGPQQQVGVRELRGQGWAVGILFRPAATPLVSSTPAAGLIAAEQPIEIPGHGHVAAAVESVMAGPSDPPADRAAITRVMETWLAPLADRVTDWGRLANLACRIAEQRDDIVQTSALADEVHASTRTVERVVREHTGFSPKWLIECRRMQNAATRLYTVPDTVLADLAVELGFADHAHFSRRYRSIIGETPDQTRKAGRAARE